MRPAKLAWFSAGVATLLAAGSASAGDSISAEALFQAGRDAAVRGEYREACDKFAESQRLDPAPGTLINLGDCNEHLGHFASAWRYYREAVDRLPGDKRVADLRARVAAIEPRLSRLTLRLAPGAPADTKVARDEVALGAASLGLAMPIDAGEHVVVVTAPGREAKRYTVKIVEAQASTLEVEAGAASRAIEAPPPPPTLPPPPPSALGSGRTIGIVIGSLGVASLAAAGVTGGMTIQRKSTVEQDCPDQRCRTMAGIDAASQGKTLSLVSTVTFVTGLVGVGVGAYLVIAGGSKSTPAVALATTITPDTTGVRLLGRF
jgi:hypothetical protein